MKIKLFLLLALTALGLWLAAPLRVARACEPFAEDVNPEASRCLPRVRVVAAAPSSAMLPASVAPARTGTTAADALNIPNDWRTLAPRASVWYHTTNNDNYRVLELQLETNPPNLVSLAIYSPDQMAGAISMDKPIGRGTTNKGLPENVLFWKAGYARPGAWFALVTNNTGTNVLYKLSHNQQDTSTKNCFGYWEYIGTTRIYWVDCSGRTPP